MDNSNYIVAGMGEALWDMLPDGRKIGGAPANFAYHVSQFGLPGCVVSAVGADALGAEIVENFTAKGLQQHIAEVPYPTGTVRVTLDEKGIPEYDITENVAWDNIPFTPALKELAGRTRAVCFGSLAQRSPVSRATIAAFLDSMPATEDTLKVFDINLRQNFYSEALIIESLNRCNILKINDEELAIIARMFGLADKPVPEQCWMLVEKYNLKGLILTCGVNGSYVFAAGDVSFMPTPSVEVADTVGAGDSFTAAFVASILKGDSVADAHRRAVEVSAFVCSRNGAMPLLPDELTA